MLVQKFIRNIINQIENFDGTQGEYLDLLIQMRDECAIRAEGVAAEINNSRENHCSE